MYYVFERFDFRQVDVIERRIAKHGTLKVGLGQYGSGEFGRHDVGTAEVGIAEVGIAEVGTAKVGTAEVGAEHELAELKREHAELAKQAERLAGRARDLREWVDISGKHSVQALYRGKSPEPKEGCLNKSLNTFRSGGKMPTSWRFAREDSLCQIHAACWLVRLRGRSACPSVGWMPAEAHDLALQVEGLRLVIRQARRNSERSHAKHLKWLSALIVFRRP